MGANRVEAGRRGRPNTVKSRGRNKSSRGKFLGAIVAIAIIGAAAIGYKATRPTNQPAATAVDPNLAREAEGYLLGDSTAPVQILEFADYECPACAQFATVTAPDVRKRLVETGQASYRFFDFPLRQHRNSRAASNAAACADDQGKYWPMHDRIFAGQMDWNTQATSNPKKVFQGYARELGLDVGAWEACYDSDKHQRRISANEAEGERRQVRSTPTFVIGDRMVPGALSFDHLKALVDSAAQRAGAAPAGAADSTRPPAPAGTAR
jgi:protein-disulfide isomerase